MSDQDHTNAEPPPEGRSTDDWAYTSEDLQHLSDLEHVRERPAMYIGDTGSRRLGPGAFRITEAENTVLKSLDWRPALRSDPDWQT